MYLHCISGLALLGLDFILQECLRAGCVCNMTRRTLRHEESFPLALKCVLTV